MKAAIVTESGKVPVFGEFSEPASTAGKEIIRVEAAAISQLTRARASGTHYSSSSVVPFIPGVDGVGVKQDGQRVYFLARQEPFGAMAEFCLIDESDQVPVPDDLDSTLAAAMAIPGMSSWAALVERAHLIEGETVLVNGATGTSGRLAIQIAKHLGAKKVIATGRQSQMFDELHTLGADVTLSLLQQPDELERSFSSEFAEGVDIVLDYLWGASAESIIVSAAKAGPEGYPVRYVQIGTMSGTNISLQGAALRSSGLQLLGSGIGSVPIPKLLQSIGGVFNATSSAGFTVATDSVSLAEVTEAWATSGADGRIVLVP